jgi:hypothetical protein
MYVLECRPTYPRQAPVQQQPSKASSTCPERQAAHGTLVLSYKVKAGIWHLQQ